jgi:predicted outer membrane repeat protein
VKRVTLFLIAALSLLQLSAQESTNRIFVMPGGSGNGTSWSSPLGDLHQALAIATPGTEIWVCAGTYLTTSGTNRSLYFQIPSGVKLYGGFAGHEQSIDARNIEHHPTILSGEIGQPASDDNAYTVVYTENVSSQTLIDGFIITGGSANKELANEILSPEVGGAGWFNIATKGESSPTITRCKFIDNNAREGAGFMNLAKGGTVNPKITKCQFIRNIARLDGGAIYNGAYGKKSTPRISNCRFEYNVATYGAGILNKANEGSITAMVKSCHFVSNQAHFRGPGIYNDFYGQGSSKSYMVGCIFDKNTSTSGDAVSSRSGSYDNDASDNINSRGY